MLQVLEGPKNTLFDLFQKIRDDKRHTDVVVDSSGHVLWRQFSGWEMNLIVGESSTILSSLQYEALIPESWGEEGLTTMFNLVEEFHTQSGVTGEMSTPT